MKKLFLFFTLACCIIVTAQSKYSPTAQFIINNLDTHIQRVKGEHQAYIPATLRASDIEVLEQYGIIIGSQIGDYVTTLVPTSLYPQLGNIQAINYIDAGNLSYPLLNKALPEIGYYQIQETPHTQPYTGKGVIVGIVDIGFQWDHIAFRKEDGSTRILAAWNQNDTTGVPPETFSYGSLYDTQEELYTAPHCLTEIHGTHVASIAAGSAIKDIPYGGVAREASLILVDALHDERGGIYDEGIIDGINFIFDYADRMDMPCVINLSIGGLFGPHDGTSAFDIMCDSLQGEGRLIVGAMGNSGQQYYHLGYDFDTQPSEFMAGMRHQNNSLPVVDIWSDEPIQVDFAIYHGYTDTILDHTGWLPLDTMYENTLQYFDREVIVEAASQKYPENNRYNTIIATSGIKNLGNAYFALKVQGKRGKVNMWVNSPGTQFSTRGLEGWQGGDTEMTLNETGGTGKRITSVGAYTTDTLKESRIPFKVYYEMGDITPFSSRGLTPDGRIKPEIVAPGSLITAAFNKALASDPQNYYYNQTVDTFVIGDSTYHYGVNSGTSMAAPVVTGIYALWLQANPQLTPEEAKKVLRLTARKDAYTTHQASAGYGKIAPYAGLCHILEKSYISTTSSLPQVTLYPTIGNGVFNVATHDSKLLQLDIYNSNGILIATHHTVQTTCNTSLQYAIEKAVRGVYFIKITTTTGSKTYKYLVNQ